MRRRTLGSLLAGVVASVGLLAIGLPAEAHHAQTTGTMSTAGNQVSGFDNHTDANVDTACIDDGTPTTVGPAVIPGTGQPLPPGRCNNQIPLVDMHEYSMKSTKVAGPDGLTGTSDDIPALQATFRAGAPIPAENVLMAPVQYGLETIGGFTYRVHFNVPDVQDNRPLAVCERNTSTDVRKTYLYWGSLGWHGDGHKFSLEISYTYTGGKYLATPSLGYFDPSADGGYVFYDLRANELLNPGATSEPPTGKGKFYDWTYNADRTAVTVTVLGVIPVRDNNCKFNPLSGQLFGIANYPFARTASQKGADPFYTLWRSPATRAQNDRIINAYFNTNIDTSVQLPVTVPAGDIPVVSDALGQDDISAIGGFTGWVDRQTVAGVNQYQSGIGRKGLLTGDAPGPTCWTPTFGGTAPSNPLHNAGGPCAVDNPIGPEFLNTGGDFDYTP